MMDFEELDYLSYAGSPLPTMMSLLPTGRNPHQDIGSSL
uniref:Uncharacterized protein n=1 Tax=Picea glauca TaxID=3330 RepID=A0A101M1E3_PICGL|nr:hypothetical protein ABT39_MTgene3805 [Picea glauca]QHR87510.1 hypothetical protein Q903MT_gene1521 [Picea sitchensis]